MIRRIIDWVINHMFKDYKDWEPMSDKTVTVRSGMDFFGVCFILFVNFGDSKYDLYDAIMHWLMK